MEAKNTRGTDIQNVSLKKDKTKVSLTFDMDKNEGLSSTGNSVIISSSHGEVQLDDNTFISYNVYRKLPKEERVKAKKVTATAKKEPEIDAKLVAAIAKALKGM